MTTANGENLNRTNMTTANGESLHRTNMKTENDENLHRTVPDFSAQIPHAGDHVDSGNTMSLRTPAKRCLSSEIASHEVRKRQLSQSPDGDNDNDNHSDCDEKKRNVAKSLFGPSGKKEVGRAVRSLYGPPLQEENVKLLNELECKMELKLEEFMQRYVILEEL